MLTISRMKSLLSVSPFSPRLSKAMPFDVYSLASKSSCNLIPPILQIPISLHTKPRSIPPKSPVSSIQNRSLQSESSRSSSDGEIHVILGPMFAGKTTTLIHRIQSEIENGRSVAIIKSKKDTRYRLDSIVTHDGMEMPCSALASLSSYRQKIGLDAYDKLDVIGIDEAQFFDDLYDFCREAADRDGKTIIVAGLDGDYLRRSFGSVVHIIPLANSVTKLTARCEICGKRAFFTLRKTQEIQTELIGGADAYMPVCRQHYVAGQVALDTARRLTETQNVECSAYA